MAGERSEPPAGRRCRRRRLQPGARRPTDLLVVFFSAGIALLVAGAAAGAAHAVTGAEALRWLALHLVFLGGVSQLVLGAGQFFVCAFLATEPPSRRLVGAQIVVWNAGTLLVAFGVWTAVAPLVDVGDGVIVLGLVLFAAGLRGMQRRSLQHARWAVRWYQACAPCLGLGAMIGVLLARGTAWPHGSLLGAHLALNLLGWFGTAIVGTLHTFFPSLTHTQLRFPRLQGPTFALWLLGVGQLALGAAFAVDAIVVLGCLELAAAAALLVVNLAASLRAAPDPLALPARLIAVGQAFLAAGLLVALAATAMGGIAAPFAGAPRGALAVLLLAGWIGLTVAGALLHLLAVLARVRRFSATMPAPRPARDRLVVAAAGTGVSAVALSHVGALDALAAPGTAALVTVAVFLGVRILAAATAAFRAAVLRPT
jgi:nitrite reductase (NO-forming)